MADEAPEPEDEDEKRQRESDDLYWECERKRQKLLAAAISQAFRSYHSLQAPEVPREVGVALGYMLTQTLQNIEAVSRSVWSSRPAARRKATGQRGRLEVRMHVIPPRERPAIAPATGPAVEETPQPPAVPVAVPAAVGQSAPLIVVDAPAPGEPGSLMRETLREIMRGGRSGRSE